MSRSRNGLSNGLTILSGLIAVLGSLGFARFGYSAILPGMKDGLALTYTQMGLIESVSFSGYFISAVLCGVLASRYGPRIVIAISLGLVGASMLLTSFTTSFSQTVILRGLTGLGSGGAAPAMMLPVAWISAKKRGLASGIISSGAGGGLVFTGLLVPKLNSIYGKEAWRYSWLILGLVTLVFAIFCALSIRDPPETVSKHKQSWRLEWRSLGDSLLWKIGVVYLMFGLSYIIYVIFFNAYLVKEAGLTPQSAGLLWALVGSLSLASGPLWGHLSDRIGRGYGLTIVFIIQSLSFFFFAQQREIETFYYFSAILFGITLFSIPSIVAAYSGEYFGPRLAFSAIGVLTVFFGVGQAFGPSVGGYLADLTQTFTTGFRLSSLVALVGGLLSLLILSKRRMKNADIELSR